MSRALALKLFKPDKTLLISILYITNTNKALYIEFVVVFEAV
jgi:hypothetical protein